MKKILHLNRRVNFSTRKKTNQSIGQLIYNAMENDSGDDQDTKNHLFYIADDEFIRVINEWIKHI